MKKSHLLLIGATTSLALAAAFVPGVSKAVLGGADYSSGTWVHYAQKDATKTEKGIREYWIMCGSGTHQFTAPLGVTPVEADTYDTTGFRVDDDRWITPVVVDAQEVVMTDATKSVDLGAYSDMTVTAIKTGELDLGTDAADLDVSGFAADHSDDGVRDVVAYGVKEGKGYAVFTETTFITKTIATKAEWENTVVPTITGQVINGYYKVTADITLDKYPAWISGWDTAMFSGTIDGGNHKVTVGQGNYGQFYVLNRATLKNMTIHNPWWRRITTGYAMFAQKSLDSTFENLTFDVPTVASGATDSYFPENNYGYLFNNGGAQRNAFKNCSWDFGNYDLPCLLCHSNNNTDSNTFEDCTLTCKSFGELYSTKNGSIISSEGLSVELTDVEVVSMDSADIDLSAETKSVTLPVYYTGIDVIDIALTVEGTKYSLGSDLSNLNIPSAVVADKAHHGETSLLVKYHWDATKIKTLQVPVTLVTSVINDAAGLLTIAHGGAGVTTYGYYKLASNINISSSGWTEFTSSTLSTFSGTLDGNGMTITSKSRSYGLFATLENATLKNLTVLDAWSYGGCDMAATLISQDMKSTTMENCTFRITNQTTRTLKTGDEFPIDKQNYGWINSRVCQDNKFKDCTFDAGTKVPVQTLLGTHSSCIRITFENSTFSCGTYYCLYQSNYTGLVTTTAEGLTVTGTCAYVAA